MPFSGKIIEWVTKLGGGVSEQTKRGGNLMQMAGI